MGNYTAEQIGNEMLGSIFVENLKLHGVILVFESDWQELEKVGAKRKRKSKMKGFTVERFNKLRAEGRTMQQIADGLGVRYWTIRKWARENGIPPQKGGVKKHA